MSVSRAQLNDFAKYVNGHEALGEFIKRVDAKMFDQFAQAKTDKDRLKVGDKFDAFTMLISDMKQVLDEMLQAEKRKEDDKYDKSSPAST